MALTHEVGVEAKASLLAALGRKVTRVFVSYAREDRESVTELVQFLRSKGVRVMWDQDVPPGEKYRLIIERAIRRAHVVIVVWSRASVRSHWVEGEADLAFNKGTYLPVLLERVEVRIPFNAVQALDLTGGELDGLVPGVEGYVRKRARGLAAVALVGILLLSGAAYAFRAFVSGGGGGSDGGIGGSSGAMQAHGGSVGHDAGTDGQVEEQKAGAPAGGTGGTPGGGAPAGGAPSGGSAGAPGSFRPSLSCCNDLGMSRSCSRTSCRDCGLKVCGK